MPRRDQRRGGGGDHGIRGGVGAVAQLVDKIGQDQFRRGREGQGGLQRWADRGKPARCAVPVRPATGAIRIGRRPGSSVRRKDEDRFVALPSSGDQQQVGLAGKATLPCKKRSGTKAFNGGIWLACKPNRPNSRVRDDAVDGKAKSRSEILLGRNRRFERKKGRFLRAQQNGVARSSRPIAAPAAH